MLKQHHSNFSWSKKLCSDCFQWRILDYAARFTPVLVHVTLSDCVSVVFWNVYMSTFTLKILSASWNMTFDLLMKWGGKKNDYKQEERLILSTAPRWIKRIYKWKNVFATTNKYMLDCVEPWTIKFQLKFGKLVTGNTLQWGLIFNSS